MRPTSRSSKAFTLAEAMVTLGLLVVVFGVVAELLHRSHLVLREQSYKNQATQAVQLALNRMSCEVRECSNVTNASGSTLTLEIVDPNYTTAGPPFVASDPYDSHNLCTVTYSLSNGILQRTITPSSGGAVTQDLVQGITGMNCSYTPPNGSATPAAVNITLSLADLNLGVRSLATIAYPMAVYP